MSTTATRPAAAGAPPIERIRHAADNGCTGYTDQSDIWHACDAPLRARMHFTDLCRECHAKQERADELREGIAATLAPPAPAETPQRGDKADTPFACAGWINVAGVQFACETPDQPHLARGQCRRCYTKGAAARRMAREAGAELPPPLVAAAPLAPPAPPRGEWRTEPDPAPVGPDSFGGEDTPPAPAAATLAANWREQPAEALAAALIPPPSAPAPAPDAYAWTVFDQPPHTGVGTEPRITVVADGNCRLNGPAYALWKREVAAVEILHDPERRAVALRPCDPAKRHARLLRPDKNARCCSLRAFRKAVALFPPGVVVATPRLVAPDLLVFDLPPTDAA